MRNPDGPERAEAERWVEERPDHAVAFAQVERAWRAADRLKALPETHPVLDTARPQPAAAQAAWRPTRRQMIGGGALAASLAMLAGLPVAWNRLAGQNYETGIGERRDVRLADGSILHLNTATRLRVRLDADRRALDLVAGEASFDVAHDTARPFDVAVGALTVRAVGTRFDIRRGPQGAELTVTEGKVAVRRGDVVIGYAAAGEGAALQGTGAAFARLDAATVDRRTAWRQDLIELDGATIAQAVAEFNRYRDKPLVVGDARVAGLRVGGRFDTRDAERFVAALRQSFPVRTAERADGATLLLYGANGAP